MSVIVDCVKTYWRSIHKQFLLQSNPEKYAKTLDTICLHRWCQGVRTDSPLSAVKYLENLLQHTNTRRHAAKDFCADMDIPLNDAMAMLDTDYASEPQTCGSDTEDLDSTADRHVKAGLGQDAKKVVGFEWRSPDVSKELIFLYCKNSSNCLVCCLSPLVIIPIFQRTRHGCGS